MLAGILEPITERASGSPSSTAARAGSLAVKDLFDTAGVRTTYGSAIFPDHVPEATAEAVLRLEAAGYVTVGKANLHEFAWGITSENPHYGDGAEPAGAGPRSPAARAAAARRRWRPGSSTRRSAPTPAARSASRPRAAASSASSRRFGLVPIDGCWPLAPSFDHAGRWRATWSGCERMLEALVAGFAPADGVAGRPARWAWPGPSAPTRWCASGSRPPRVAPAARRACRCPTASIRRSRARSAEVARRPVSRRTATCTGTTSRTSSSARSTGHRRRGGGGGRGARALPRADRRRCRASTCCSRRRCRWSRRRSGVGDLALRERMIELTFPWNVIGAPALALPCGAAEDGLPASLQLVGRPGEDALVLAAGRALSAAAPAGVQRRDDGQRLAAGGRRADPVVPDHRQAHGLGAGHVAGGAGEEDGRHVERVERGTVRLRSRLVEPDTLGRDQQVHVDAESRPRAARAPRRCW